MREWSYSSIILDLGTRWMWVVSFTPQPLYLHSRYYWDRRVGGPQSQSGRWRRFRIYFETKWKSLKVPSRYSRSMSCRKQIWTHSRNVEITLNFRITCNSKKSVSDFRVETVVRKQMIKKQAAIRIPASWSLPGYYMVACLATEDAVRIDNWFY
jgi:hypothetical protein